MENLGSYDSGVPFRKFIFIFLLVCIVIGTGVFYSALSKATITIVPKSNFKEVSAEVTVDGNLAHLDLGGGILAGEIKTRVAEGSEKGIEVTLKKIDEFAKGKIIIRNNTPYTQGVRQGALLRPVGAPDGVIFSTVQRAMLPPKQSKEIDIVATFKGAKGNLPPGKFEFLNLETAYMRENLWAENKEKIEGGIREAKVVTEEDLERAYTQLAKRMFKKTLEEINKDLAEGNLIKEESANYTIIEKKASVIQGAETESFDIQAKIEVSGVTINENDLKSIAEKKVQELGGANEEFSKFDPDSFSYTLTSLNIPEKKSTLKIKLKGQFHSKLSSKIFDKESIIGYNEKALMEHFDKYDNIAEIKVKFWPPFRKTVPNVESRIDINVKTE